VIHYPVGNLGELPALNSVQSVGIIGEPASHENSPAWILDRDGNKAERMSR
jgi:hypothetical protein